MAMYDWNGNGNKNDMADNYMEYQIYKDCTSNNKTPRSSTNTSGSSFLIVFIIACIVDALCDAKNTAELFAIVRNEERCSVVLKAVMDVLKPKNISSTLGHMIDFGALMAQLA